MRLPLPHLLTGVAALAAALAAAGVPAAAQAPGAASSRAAASVTAPAAAPACARGLCSAVEGTVIDAASDRPLAGASVAARRLDPEDGDSPAARAATTDTTGAYRIAALPPGRYLLRMRALGYRPTDVAVQVDSASARHLSVGLRVVPVRLQPVAVRTAGGDAYGRAAPADDARLLRVRAESARAVRYLDADSRVITDGEIRDAVTLAEPDLFRGLQRLPGVGARDDYTAALWTRGAPWDQTLVTLDGVPLYNALHAAGLVSAVDTDALGAVSFHPGVQPAGAGGASALVRLETRRGASPRPRALGELSLLSGRLAVDQVVAGGRAAYMVAARRSHVDLVPRALDLVRGAAGDRIPYAFGDVTARGDLALGGGRALEVSGVRAWDRVWGDVPGVVEETRAGWANAAARATLVAPLGAGVVRHTVAASRFAASARDTWDGELPGFRPDSCGCVYEQDPTYVAQPTDNAVRAAFLGTAWDGPAGDDGEPAVTLGARLTRERARFRTRGAWPHARRPGGMAARPDDGLGYLSMWAERRWTARSPLGAVAVRPALHVDLGPEVRNGGAVRVAPRVAARAALSPALALTAGAARTYQYTQAVSPPALGQTAIATAGTSWVVAGRVVPAVQADVVTLGAERALGARAVASVAAYRRRATGVAAPSPAAGSLAGRPLFVEAANEARGVEVSARRLAGRWTGAWSYAYGTSELEAGGVRFSAPWERRHVMNASAGVALGGGVRAASAYTAAAGAPYTRYYAGVVSCAAGGCDWSRPPAAGPASGERAGAYRRLDASLDWTRDWGARDPGRAARQVGVFVQAHNLLGRANPAAYLDSDGRCVTRAGRGLACDPLRGVWERTADAALTGLSATVAAGVRAAF
jgi:hypothetical protein